MGSAFDNVSFLVVEGREAQGGGGTLNFSAYIGSDPASTLHQKKKYQEFQIPQKNI